MKKNSVDKRVPESALLTGGDLLSLRDGVAARIKINELSADQMTEHRAPEDPGFRVAFNETMR